MRSVTAFVAHGGLFMFFDFEAQAVDIDAEQVHVSVTGEASITVSWASPRHQLAQLMIEEVVAGSIEDGKRSGPVSQSNDTVLGGTRRIFKPNATQYSILCGIRYAVTCRSIGIYDSPLLLHAHVAVTPSTKYRYRIGSGSVWGSWRGFSSPPAAGARELRIAVVGDLGQTHFSRTTCADLAQSHAAQRLDVGVLVGDLSYADTDNSRWDSFGRLFDKGGCSDIPWLVLPGNHEIEPDDLSGESFIPYRHRWRTPEVALEQVGSDSRVIDWGRYDLHVQYDFGGSFYSVRLGNTHFIMLNPYTAGDEASAQVAWLRQEVLRVNRSVTPNLLVFTHAPFYHSSAAHQAANEVATSRLMQSVLPILMDTKVDIVFSGHVHAYERTHPIDGMTHIVVGHGGNYEQLYNEWTISNFSAVRFGDHYGWGTLHLFNNESLWSARRSSDGLIVDSVRLSRSISGEQVSDQLALFNNTVAPEASANWLVGLVVIASTFIASCALVVVCCKVTSTAWRPLNAKPEERAKLSVNPATVGAET